MKSRDFPVDDSGGFASKRDNPGKTEKNRRPSEVKTRAEKVVSGTILLRLPIAISVCLLPHLPATDFQIPDLEPRTAHIFLAAPRRDAAGHLLEGPTRPARTLDLEFPSRYEPRPLKPT